MEKKKMWKFAPIPVIEEPVFNNILEKFYDLGVDGLIRENIQNSLDGKLKVCEYPVEIHIEIGEIEINQIPGINEIKERISCLRGENINTQNTITHMKKRMQQKKVAYISFEDRNTKGLSGAKNGQNFTQNDTWGIYAYKKGVHFFEENSADESIRGGSYGVGKIASNAASDLHIMFFANCDSENNQHLGGTIQLIEHSYQDKYYRSTGYFTDEQIDKNGNNIFIPYNNEYDEIFRKDTRGLKIIIPFFREQFNNYENVVRSICDNFFLAILEKSLIVYINQMQINALTILKIIDNKKFYEQSKENMIDINFTPLYIKTYLNTTPVKIEIDDTEKSYTFFLYFFYSEKIRRGRMAVVRRIGMKIEDKKIKNYVNSPFNAVLIPVSDQEDIFLKSLENASHTSLTFEHIKSPIQQRNAKRFINNISRKLGLYISEMIQQNNPSDGMINTTDLLYSIESNFKKDLKKEVSTVILTKGNNDSQKILVKVKTQSNLNKKHSIPKKNPQDTIKSIIRKAKKKDGIGREKHRIRYTMHPETVKRLVLNDRELLNLDFSHNEKYDGETSCNISLSLIDGAGKEYNNEFDIKTSYSLIIDKNFNKECQVNNNIIQNVSIHQKKIQLELKTTTQFNESLKFIYYVEV